MPEGTIIKALSGFYYVKDGDRLIQCRARGVFRKRKVTPFVGDQVTYQVQENEEGYIQTVGKRKNQLVRPPIANVDQAILVFSVSEPTFDSQLLDRFLVYMEAGRIQSVICLTKWDLLGEEEAQSLREKMNVYRQIGYPVLITSTKKHEGINDLRSRLRGQISVVTGQSGVGKSSLLNELDDSLQIDTQSISQSLGRGKHTTRHVELVPIEENGYVADTPGFSSIDFPDFSLTDLEQCFPEFAAFRDSCRFRGCMHMAEPDCAVKAAVSDRRIDAERYEHYQSFYQEIKNRKRRY